MIDISRCHPLTYPGPHSWLRARRGNTTFIYWKRSGPQMELPMPLFLNADNPVEFKQAICIQRSCKHFVNLVVFLGESAYYEIDQPLDELEYRQ